MHLICFVQLQSMNYETKMIFVVFENTMLYSLWVGELASWWLVLGFCRLLFCLVDDVLPFFSEPLKKKRSFGGYLASAIHKGRRAKMGGWHTLFVWWMTFFLCLVRCLVRPNGHFVVMWRV
jgi:hypothetical protein